MAQEIKKQLINPVPIGGVPVFADDLLRVQENAKNSIIAFYEGLSRGGFTFDEQTGPGETTPRTTPGLFLNIPTYTLTDDGSTSSTFLVGEFFAFLDGEICYYPGGELTFNALSAASKDVYAVIKGQPLKQSRVYKDGQQNETLVTNTIELYRAQYQGLNEIPSEIVGKSAVCIDRTFDSNDKGSGRYFLNHPNSYTEALGLNDIRNSIASNESNSQLQKINLGLDLNLDTAAVLEQMTARKKDGFVQLEGIVTFNTVTNTPDPLFTTLPIGWRPIDRDIEIYSNIILGTNISNDRKCIKIKQNGEISVSTPQNLPTSPNNFNGNVSLFGITFQI